MTGLVIDSEVFILAARSQQALNFSAYTAFGQAYLSAVTASELMVGVHRAQDPAIRARRSAFVEGILARIPVLPFTLEVARTHALLLSNVPRNSTVGAHDALIAATALSQGYAVLTRNGKDFRKMDGVEVVDFV